MITSKRLVKDLDTGLILIPERYDPRRRQEITGIRLADLAISVKDSFNPTKTSDDQLILVLDTGDADRGLLAPKNHPVPARLIGSNKKIVKSGDVIISRLRPYLRQIAHIPLQLASKGIVLACSTEFFVLRTNDETSIAFLVKWLLEDQTQEILRVGQEGGHHPRFTEEHLMSLVIPEKILNQRAEISLEIERASLLNIEIMQILGAFAVD